MSYNYTFLLIKISDNDFSQRIYDACKLLIPLFEDARDNICQIDDKYTVQFLASSVARLSALEADFYSKVYNDTSNDYTGYFDRTKNYLVNNIFIEHDFDKIVNDLSNSTYRIKSVEDFGLSDIDQLKFYLKTNTDDFAILPYLYWCNQERILIRVCFDHSSYKSQTFLY